MLFFKLSTKFGNKYFYNHGIILDTSDKNDDIDRNFTSDFASKLTLLESGNRTITKAPTKGEKF
ncbi:MAG TPA: hypothetical protein DCS91_21860 [Microcoleaceae bacterium UBA11344]|jgi:hypothetical protein|nr:hypothetical protein [Microcoleaceae cyanobacterium UBA11344]